MATAAEVTDRASFEANPKAVIAGLDSAIQATG
jgi:hypothetical protein